MADERIDIEITDKVSPSIRSKLIGIAEAARTADTAVDRLKANLAAINTTGIQRLQTALNTSTNALTRNSLATQKLATAQTQGATAAQRLATEQHRTAAASAAAQAAQDRAALAALRLRNAQNGATVAARGHGNALTALGRNVAAIVGIGLSAHAIIQAGDAYTTLQNKLRNVAETEERLAAVSNEVFNIAKETRTPVLETAQAFARFDLAMKGLGASQKESLELTETVNKALIVGGATTGEAAAGLLQLSQAFNKGKLDGDEFRTVMELMPSVADAIAKQMGVARGELLKLAPQGKITGDVMRKAFAAARVEIAEKFARTIPTMGQAFQVLRNEAIRTFGEFDKAVGITAGISSAFLALANNMKAVGVAAGIASAVIVAGFGPRLIGFLTRAGGAMLAFTAAAAANPLGLLLIALAAAAGLFAVFKDDIKTSADGIVTLGDTVQATFQIIGEMIAPVFELIKYGWQDVTKFIKDSLKEQSDEHASTISDILGYVKTGINKFVGFWVGGVRSVIMMFEQLPGLISDVFTGRKTILEAVSELAGNIKTELQSAFDFDFVGSAVTNIQTRARQIANNRLKPKRDGLRPAGPAAKISENDKAAERRALALAKINAELDKELQRMGMLRPEREAQQRLDEIEVQLLGRKIKLTDTERATIRKKIDLIQSESVVMAQMDRIYEDSIGPLRDYEASRTALNRLAERGAISGEQYNRALNLARLAYEDSVNPLIGINREMDDQLKLLKFVGAEQIVQQQLQQIQNDLRRRGIDLSSEENDRLETRLRIIQRETDVNRELNRIYDETRGLQQNIYDRLTATHQAFIAGYITLDNYKLRLAALGVEAANLRLKLGTGDFNDTLISSLGRLVENYEGILPGLANTFGDFFQTLNEGFANSIGRAIVYSEDLGAALHEVARSALSELIGALVKLGIQYVINATLGTTLAGAATAANAAMAGASAAAWAPAAAMASLASFGANAAPAMAGIASTMTLAQTLATVGSMFKGFAQGGFTGLGGRSDLAGVVHGQEFVVNAEGTSRNRAALEAMNRGATFVKSNSSTGERGGGMNVHIENYGTSKEFEAQQIDENTIRLIARDEAKTAVNKHSPGVIAQQISDPNSSVSKSMSRNTKTARKR